MENYFPQWSLVTWDVVQQQNGPASGGVLAQVGGGGRWYQHSHQQSVSRLLPTTADSEREEHETSDGSEFGDDLDKFDDIEPVTANTDEVHVWYLWSKFPVMYAALLIRTIYNKGSVWQVISIYILLLNNILSYFSNNVYMGDSKPQPQRQPHHEKMIEQILMQQTGHDCLHCWSKYTLLDNLWQSNIHYLWYEKLHLFSQFIEDFMVKFQHVQWYNEAVTTLQTQN